MYAVSQKFINYCKRHQRTYKSATITYDDNGTTKTITSDKIIKIEISVTPYVDYQLIGQAPAKKIHINLYGTDYDLTNKEISVTTTMLYDDNTTETLNLGSYIMTNDYESQVRDQCSYTGYDYMIKFDATYSDEGLEYPCTLQDVLNNICTQNNIQLHSINITNADLQVDGNNFDGSFTYRDVIKQIAQVSGTFAYIDRLNKLHIDNLIKVGKTGGTILQFPLQGTLQTDANTTSNFKDEITPSYYMADFKSSRMYGPVNKIQITQTDVEDATYKEDAQSISQNGIQTITINDNYFLGTIDAREYAIENLWTSLYGLTYIPFNSTYLGFPYLEMGDLIQVEQLDGTTIESYVFNYTFTYNGGYMGTLETPTISRTQEAYPTNSIEEKVGKFGFEVDRANKEVRAVAEDLSGVQAELTLKIDKDDNDQIISMINASADVITLNSNRLVINSTFFKLDANGNITATGGDIGGFVLDSKSFTKAINGLYNFTSYDLFLAGMQIMSEVDLPTSYINILDVNDSGSLTASDYAKIKNIIAGSTTNTKTGEGTFEINASDVKNCIVIKDEYGDIVTSIGLGGINSSIGIFNNLVIGNQGTEYVSAPYIAINGTTGDTKSTGSLELYDERIKLGYKSSSGIQGIVLTNTGYEDNIVLDADTGNIKCVSLTQTSLEEDKKDFEKYENALDELSKIEIYKYHLKNEKDEDKKHIGFVIGKEYSQEVTSNKNDGVDIYSFVSLCCKAIQEQQTQIKELQKEIDQLRKEK